MAGDLPSGGNRPCVPLSSVGAQDCDVQLDSAARFGCELVDWEADEFGTLARRPAMLPSSDPLYSAVVALAETLRELRPDAAIAIRGSATLPSRVHTPRDVDVVVVLGDRKDSVRSGLPRPGREFVEEALLATWSHYREQATLPPLDLAVYGARAFLADEAELARCVAWREGLWAGTPPVALGQRVLWDRGVVRRCLRSFISSTEANPWWREHSNGRPAVAMGISRSLRLGAFVSSLAGGAFSRDLSRCVELIGENAPVVVSAARVLSAAFNASEFSPTAGEQARFVWASLRRVLPVQDQAPVREERQMYP